MERVDLRRASAGDATCLGVLAVQVFLDTYATEGVPGEIAREVLASCSPDAYSRRLAEPGRQIHVAEREHALVGFVELAFGSPCPVRDLGPAIEVDRLYVQRPFLRQGLGSAMLAVAEKAAVDAGARFVWLSAWTGNAPALAFYRAMGYEDIGRVDHVFEGRAYGNRVFAKRCA
jgi:diamine N-acetyltransferase